MSQATDMCYYVCLTFKSKICILSTLNCKYIPMMRVHLSLMIFFISIFFFFFTYIDLKTIGMSVLTNDWV